jgi:hypothetical protein
MITAETLKVLTSYSAPFLTKAAKLAGYKGPAFSSCKFLGITNGGQFCYMAVFLVNPGKSHDADSTKVFLTYNHAEDRVFADVQLTELA